MKRTDFEAARHVLHACAAFADLSLETLLTEKPHHAVRALLAVGFDADVVSRVTDVEVAVPANAKQIVADAGDWFGVTYEEMRSASRKQSLMVARRLAAKWLRDAGYKLQEIAWAMGRKDHTTAINWLEKQGRAAS